MIEHHATLLWFIWAISVIAATWGLGLILGSTLIGPIIALFP